MATWSITAVDPKTKEVGIVGLFSVKYLGSSCCLTTVMHPRGSVVADLRRLGCFVFPPCEVFLNRRHCSSPAPTGNWVC